MAKKIANLDTAGALNGADLLWLEQSEAPFGVSLTTLSAYFGGGSVPGSTAASTILRGDGSGGWAEETSVTVDSNGRMRLTHTGDAGLASTDHPFQVGLTASTNIIIDGNEVMARDNGAGATLYLNADGGASGGVNIGNAAVGTPLAVNGPITGTDLIRIANNVYYQAKDFGGTYRSVLGANASDDCFVSASAFNTVVRGSAIDLSSGTINANGNLFGSGITLGAAFGHADLNLYTETGNNDDSTSPGKIWFEGRGGYGEWTMQTYQGFLRIFDSSKSVTTANFSMQGTGMDLLGYLAASGAITGSSFGGITSANLVDKSAIEDITSKWIFSAVATGSADGGAATFKSTQPGFMISEEGGPVDEKHTLIYQNDGVLHLRAYNDAFSASADFLTFTRSGINMATSLVGALAVTGALTATSYGGITESNLVDKSAAETISADWVHTQDLGVRYGSHGDYTAVGGTSAYGATIWSMGPAFHGGTAANNSSSAGVYGIRWQRASHSSADPSVGEGLYLYQNGTYIGGFGSAGLETPFQLKCDGSLYIGGDVIGHFETVSGSYGSVQVDGAEGSSGTWSGYNIGGRHVFMDNGSNQVGIYNDNNDEWLIKCVDSAQVQLYFDNVEQLTTQNNTVLGQTTGAVVKTHAGVLQDVGLNLLPTFNFNATDTLEASHCGHMTGKTNTTAYTLTGPASGDVDFPVTGVATVMNLGASVDYTIADTASCTMYYCDGAAAPVDIVGTGLLAPGGVITIWRYSTTAIYIFGSGFTP